MKRFDQRPAMVLPTRNRMTISQSRRPKWVPVMVLVCPAAFLSLPCQAGAIDAELDQAPVLDLGDVDSAAIRPAKAEVAGKSAQDGDLAQDLALGGDFDDGTFPVAGDVQVAVHVGAHSVKAVVGKLDEQPLVRQGVFRSDRECPDVPLDALVDIERFPVRA